MSILTSSFGTCDSWLTGGSFQYTSSPAPGDRAVLQGLDHNPAFIYQAATAGIDKEGGGFHEAELALAHDFVRALVVVADRADEVTFGEESVFTLRPFDAKALFLLDGEARALCVEDPHVGGLEPRHHEGSNLAEPDQVGRASHCSRCP